MQYFKPSLSDYFLLRSLFCLFLRGRLTQVLLYLVKGEKLKKRVIILESWHSYKKVFCISSTNMFFLFV